MSHFGLFNIIISLLAAYSYDIDEYMLNWEKGNAIRSVNGLVHNNYYIFYFNQNQTKLFN